VIKITTFGRIKQGLSNGAWDHVTWQTLIDVSVDRAVQKPVGSTIVCLPTYLPMVLQPFVGPWRLFQFLNLFGQMVGLLRQAISQPQGRYLHTEQHKHRINARRHQCIQWDSNPRSQSSTERRQFMP
jgi:hypothetical protein